MNHDVLDSLYLVRQRRQADGPSAPPPDCSLVRTAPAVWGLAPGLRRTKPSGRPQQQQPGQLLLGAQKAGDWWEVSHKQLLQGQEKPPHPHSTAYRALAQPWSVDNPTEQGSLSGDDLLLEQCALTLKRLLSVHYGSSPTIQKNEHGQLLLCRHSDKPVWPVKANGTLERTEPMVWGEKCWMKMMTDTGRSLVRWRGWWVQQSGLPPQLQTLSLCQTDSQWFPEWTGAPEHAAGGGQTNWQCWTLQYPVCPEWSLSLCHHLNWTSTQAEFYSIA